MLNERPEGKDKFGYVLIGLLVAFVIILVTSAVIWNSNHPEKVQENFEKNRHPASRREEGLQERPLHHPVEGQKSSGLRRWSLIYL